MPCRPAGPLPEELSAAVLDRLRAGDRAAFEALVRRYGGPLYRYLLRMVGGSAAAEDLVQETLLRAYRHAAGLEPGAPPAPWLFTIARRLGLDHLRARGRRPERPLEGGAEPPDDGGPLGPPEEASRGEIARRVEATLGSLPARDREVLTLVVLEGFKYREAAHVLGVPEKTLCTWLLRAKVRFQQRFGARSGKEALR